MQPFLSLHADAVTTARIFLHLAIDHFANLVQKALRRDGRAFLRDEVVFEAPIRVHHQSGFERKAAEQQDRDDGNQAQN